MHVFRATCSLAEMLGGDAIRQCDSRLYAIPMPCSTHLLIFNLLTPHVKPLAAVFVSLNCVDLVGLGNSSQGVACNMIQW